MDINITIFFQATQFFIAYFFLYTYLFAPAYKILEDQELYEKKLYNDLNKEADVNNALHKSFYQRRIELRASLMSEVPVQVVDLVPKKLHSKVDLYRTEKIEMASNSLDHVEALLVDNLSRVIK